MNIKQMKRAGFTLMEVLIYAGILSITGTILSGVLLNTTRIQSRQTAVIEVNEQLTFVLQNIQRSIIDSSIIDIDSGTSTSTLILKFKDDTKNPTKFYIADNKMYKKVADNAAQPLTDNSVVADAVNFLKVSGYSGHDSIQIDLTLSYNTGNPASTFSRTLSSAVARVSAATFDSNLIPGSGTFYDIGTTALPWNNAYFGGKVGIGTTDPTAQLHLSTVAGTDAFVIGSTTTQFIVNKSGNVAIGTTGDDSFKLKISTTGNAFGFERYAASGGGAIGYFRKSRSATVGTNEIVQDGDTLGQIVFSGANGTTFSNGAIIQASVDGTPGASSDMPGRLSFWTTPDGSGTAVEKMRLTNAGNLGIGTASPKTLLQVSTTTAIAALGSDPTLNQVALFSGGDPGTTYINYGISLVMRPITDRGAVASIAAVNADSNKEGNAELIFSTGNGSYPSTVTERMRINATGVGIGTVVPGAALHVEGAIIAAPTGSGLLAGLNSTYGQAKLYGSDGGILDFGASGSDRKGRILYNNASNYMVFETNTSEKVRITTDGYVGIGMGGGTPTSRLQVVGLPVYANNAAALAGGLTAGAFYRTGGDPDPVCVVH